MVIIVFAFGGCCEDSDDMGNKPSEGASHHHPHFTGVKTEVQTLKQLAQGHTASRWQR
jgi:hypothetical protein